MKENGSCPHLDALVIASLLPAESTSQQQLQNTESQQKSIQEQPTITPVYQETVKIKEEQPQKAPQPSEQPNYYINSAGNEVQSPTRYDSVPAGASALCRDGTYSFSQSRRGTCSHHGGVDEWF